jgi:prepilin-type N-terminal cleavage/methylation domain-containing protein
MNRNNPEKYSMKKSGFTLIELLFVVAVISVLAAIAVPNFLEVQIRAKRCRGILDLSTTAAALEHYNIDHGSYPPNIVDFQKAKTVSELCYETVDPKGIDFPHCDYIVKAEKRRYSNRHNFGKSEGMMFGTRSEDSYTSRIVNPFMGRDLKFGAPGMYRTENKKKIDSTEMARQDFPILTRLNSLTLRRLTTPVPYLRPLCKDPFFEYNYRTISDVSVIDKSIWKLLCRDKSFKYINIEEITGKGRYIKGRNTLYMLLGNGPHFELSAGSISQENYLEYDPTNGTISPGDIIVYGPAD